MGRHAEMLERHQRVLPSWLALYYDEPMSLVDGEGRHVVDAEGNRYLDLFAGILTTMVGYNVPEVVDAIRDQAGRMVHTSTLYLNEHQIALAEKIADMSGIPDAKVFFVASGTEANEAALLMATSTRRSNQILALRNSYHGRTFAAMSITGNRAWSASSLNPLNVSWIASGSRLRSPLAHLDDEAYLAAAATDLREVLATTTAGDVACLIAEPIQGVGGFTIPPDGYLKALKDVCDEHGILFISDEVQTGWGRTGDHLWGHQAHGVAPDLMTFAKGLGNGLAIAGVVGRAEIVDSLPANSISTFGGNHLSARGALATLEVLERDDLQGNAAKQGQRLLSELMAVGDDLDHVIDVRGRGLMIGVEFGDPGTLAPRPDLANAALGIAREQGVLIGKGGLYGNVLRIAPPLSITDEETDEAARALSETLRRTEQSAG
ncbi:MAG: aspartate aminotransferase family protein [Nitriliruptoraceae bacterium]